MPDSGRLVHLQAHYQLVLGDDMTKNFHLPVERAYLDSVGPEGLIRVPAPEFELAVFVVRMILKHSTWDAQLCLMGDLSASERRELTHLLAQVPEPGRAAAIADRLPFLSPEVVDRCLRSLESPPSRWARASIARALERDLAAYARYPRSVDLPRRTVRRGLRGARHVAGPPARKRFVDGGALIAVVGPEPAVATSVVDGLVAWLEGALAVEQFRFAGRRRSGRPCGPTVGRFASPATAGSRSVISSRRTTPLLTFSSSSSRLTTAGPSTRCCATPVSTSGRACSSRRGGTTEAYDFGGECESGGGHAGLHHEATGR